MTISHIYETGGSNMIALRNKDEDQYDINLFTTIHDGNFRRHSSMNVTIK